MGTRIKNLTEIWVLNPIKTKKHGETHITSWEYKETVYLNLQQDLNELDRNSAGEIDYDSYKARTRKNLNINKGDGIYLVKTIEGKKEELKNKVNLIAEYIVDKMPKVGRTTTYTLNKYLGE